MHKYSTALYTVDSIIQLEQIAIQQYDISAYALMQRAGQALFDVIQRRFPDKTKLLVLCGAGNNAGDGYVLATLADNAGYAVTVVTLSDPEKLKGAAAQAYRDCVVKQMLSADGCDLNATIAAAEVIVDALLGTGLKRDVSAEWKNWIHAINNISVPVLAVDIPSGLLADTGCIAGCAVKADITVCFVGLKQGMFTAEGKQVCGEVIFNSLALDERIYQAIPSDAQLLVEVDYSVLPKRKMSSHKGSFGHVLIVGGYHGMPGAVILAARAALRTGAGLVTIITDEQNLTAVSSAVPEAMVRACLEKTVDQVFDAVLIDSVSHVAIGMGLGQDDWGIALLKKCLSLKKPVLIDADALNILASKTIPIESPVIITPHPGEASRLLRSDSVHSSGDVQRDRFSAVKNLYRLVAGQASCVVLKGSGSLVYSGDKIKLCNLGGPAMAAPGMGDVLSGILVALWAQSEVLAVGDEQNCLLKITELGVCLHAGAADLLVTGNTRGLLASDVVDCLPELMQ